MIFSDDDDDDDDDDNDNDGIGGDSAAETVKFSMKEATRTAKRTKARETLFQRIEESRKSLEDELGTDRFVKVYRYIQVGLIFCFVSTYIKRPLQVNQRMVSLQRALTDYLLLGSF